MKLPNHNQKPTIKVIGVYSPKGELIHHMQHGNDLISFLKNTIRALTGIECEYKAIPSTDGAGMPDKIK